MQAPENLTIVFQSARWGYVPEHQASQSGRAYRRTTQKHPNSNSPAQISHVLALLIWRALSSDPEGAEPDSESENGYAEKLHEYYVCEMWYICVTHTLVDAPDVGVKEEEVALGMILANCAQSRWRSDRTYIMKIV